MFIRTITFQLALVAILSLSPTLTLAGDHFENGNGHGRAQGWSQKHGKRHNEGQGAGYTENSAYNAACGGCHWAYVPQLLPSASWTKILAQPEDHFGSAVPLSEQDKSVLSNYLLANAADMTPMKLGRRIMHSLNGAAPLRISEIPYILHKHRSISPAVFSRKSINSLANCIACHPSAASARFDDDSVNIPAE